MKVSLATAQFFLLSPRESYSFDAWKQLCPQDAYPQAFPRP